jgi:hypothetical protein
MTNAARAASHGLSVAFHNSGALLTKNAPSLTASIRFFPRTLTPRRLRRGAPRGILMRVRRADEHRR